MGEEVRFIHNAASRVKSITDDEAVGDGALRGGRGGAYGLEERGKRNKLFFLKEDKR